MNKKSVFSVSGVAALSVGFAAVLLVSGLRVEASPAAAGAETGSNTVLDKQASSTTPLEHLIVLHRGW
ncbi:hypothetical protein [Denitromonas halophila]|uniref:Uncharacterized protein n=1 Tax=Denitromonas halophila TaxID=1629404 RepID=A0A557QSX0_9RHOO|nr:hypothetical protein [Denitromonas halophila]TVO55988.1 hypothetical protein FHP91_11110 [Denitromonas halophila]